MTNSSHTSTEEWVASTLERANLMLEAANRVKEGESIKDVFLHYNDNDPPDWLKRFSDFHWYQLKPKRVLRPWTASEWGAHIGEDFYIDGVRWMLYGVCKTHLTLGLNGQYSLPLDALRCPTKIDKTPCGEWETPNA